MHFRKKMLYLEDFLELIETLPSEVREKCTTVRELDLSVQNQVELLQKKMQQCSSAGGVNKDDDVRHRQKVLEEVEEGYRGAMVDASEKVNVVGQLFNLVDRYSKRLDEVSSAFFHHFQFLDALKLYCFYFGTQFSWFHIF